jgi:hypothetical protein
MEDPRARNLRCDQERGHDRRHSNQPKKLIYRKHCLCPPTPPDKIASKVALIRFFHDLLLLTGQHLIGIDRPTDHDQRQNRNNGQGPHVLMLVFDCGQKRQRLAHFQDYQANNHGRRMFSVQAVLPASIVITEPVILRPPSPSRNSTIRATSSDSGKRRSALRLAIRLR